MPHYKDGTPAEIGDYVKGVPYNTKGKEVVGTLIQITEGTDSCNCIVAFVDPVVLDVPVEHLYKLPNSMLGPIFYRRKGGRIKQGDSDQTNEGLNIVAKYDYGAVKDFVKI
jgi:hypothetical protein